MPRFIGRHAPSGSSLITDADRPALGVIKLAYSQMTKLDPTDVYYVLDTSDRGARGCKAKRWYRWYATPKAILACPRSTERMRIDAGESPEPRDPSRWCTACGARTADRCKCGATAANH